MALTLAEQAGAIIAAKKAMMESKGPRDCPEEVRTTAFKLMAMGFSFREIEAQLSVPRNTLNQWQTRYAGAVQEAREDYLREAESTLTVKLQALAEESVDKARELIPEATYRDLVTGAGISTQRYSELRRGAPPPQVHVHMTREQLDSQLQELAKELDTVDATAEEEGD